LGADMSDATINGADENNYVAMGHKISRRLVPWLVGFLIILTGTAYVLMSDDKEVDSNKDKREQAITNTEKVATPGTADDAKAFLKTQGDKVKEEADRKKKENEELDMAAGIMATTTSIPGTTSEKVDPAKIDAMKAARDDSLANVSGGDGGGLSLGSSTGGGGGGVFDESGVSGGMAGFIPGSGMANVQQSQENKQLQDVRAEREKNKAELEARRNSRVETLDTPTQAKKGNLSGTDTEWKQAQEAKALESSTIIYPSRVPTRFVLLEGTIIPIVLEGDINSDLPGNIRVRVVNDIYDSIYGTALLIPKGSAAIGTYRSNVSDGQDRLMIAFNRIILKDGRSVKIPAMDGADVMGRAGINGDVNNHFWRSFSPAFLIAGVAHFLKPQVAVTNNITPGTGAGSGQTFTDATGQILIDTTTKILNRYGTNIRPTITIDRGTPMNIVVTSDIAIPPDSNFAWDVNGDIPKELRKKGF